MTIDTLQEALTYFWEVLTGVIEDEQAKMIRLLFFTLLFLGMLWAGLNYFFAYRAKNPPERYDGYISPRSNENKALDEILTIARTVGEMRKGGEALADSLSGMNRRLFTIDGYDESGMEDLTGAGLPVNLGGTAQQESSPVTVQEEADPAVIVKGVMVSGRSSLAVIETGGSKGLIVRTGEKLPGDSGRVTRIRKDGITIRYNGRDINYSIK